MIVHKPGSKVKLGETPAEVDSVMISENDRVEYRIVWWAKSTRYCEWVSAFEVDGIDGEDTLEVGFHANR